jgi:integrase
MSKSRKYLFADEVEKLIEAARQGANGTRNGLMILMAYRHGLRVSELINLRWDQINFKTNQIHINRIKSGNPSVHPLSQRELLELRKLRKRDQVTPWVFATNRDTPMTRAGFSLILRQASIRAKLDFDAHPHQLRHACGYALAAKGVDTRTIQDYSGHRNIANTVIYTQLSPEKFKRIWE